MALVKKLWPATGLQLCWSPARYPLDRGHPEAEWHSYVSIFRFDVMIINECDMSRKCNVSRKRDVGDR